MAHQLCRAGAQRFLDYVNKTGSPFHSVAAVKAILESAGFVQLSERETGGFQSIRPGGKYYVVRGGSSVMGFVVGTQFDPKRDGIVIAAGHTDSPALRIRPHANITSEKFTLLGVETYGGGLWHTWFDRGLGFAGKVVVRREQGLEEHLIRINRPLVVIPNLAIHLQTAEERAAFKFNTETHLRPLVSSAPTEKSEDVSITVRTIISEELGCAVSDVVDWDVFLMDSVPSRFAGQYEEFVDSPRIDNLASTWAIFDALVEAAKNGACEQRDILVAVSFDHEEVGSLSLTGANSSLLEILLFRIGQALHAEADFPSILARSFLLSVDGAHGVHPNYTEKYQEQHRPAMNRGVVLKENCNQRYCSQANSMAIVREAALRANLPPLQDIVVRNDSPCGTTIGPMTAARLGLRGVDIGIPQLAMHSIRELCGAGDLGTLKDLVMAVFQHFRTIDTTMKTL